jgi:acyl carrier protein
MSAQDELRELRQRVLDFVRSDVAVSQPEAASDLGTDTPLISSGLIDSLGLLQLADFVESEVGELLPVEDIDIQSEWNSVGAIVESIDRHRRRSAE